MSWEFQDLQNEIEEYSKHHKKVAKEAMKYLRYLSAAMLVLRNKELERMRRLKK